MPSTSTHAPDTLESLRQIMLRVQQGSLDVAQAAQLIAYQGSPQTAPQGGLWPTRRIAGGPSAGRLWIDCGSPQAARLARQIDAAGRFGCAHSVGEGTAEPGADPVDAEVAFALPVGESLNSLAARLGWPPPPGLRDRWLEQLDRIGQSVASRGWPLHFASLEDLRIDRSGRLHWVALPARIAQSMLSLHPSLGRRPIDQSLIDAWPSALAGAGCPAVAELQRRIRSGRETLQTDPPIECREPKPASNDSPPAAQSPRGSAREPTREPATAVAVVASPSTAAGLSRRRRGARGPLVIAASGALLAGITTVTLKWGGGESIVEQGPSPTDPIAGRDRSAASDPQTARDRGPAGGPLAAGTSANELPAMPEAADPPLLRAFDAAELEAPANDPANDAVNDALTLPGPNLRFDPDEELPPESRPLRAEEGAGPAAPDADSGGTGAIIPRVAADGPGAISLPQRDVQQAMAIAGLVATSPAERSAIRFEMPSASGWQLVPGTSETPDLIGRWIFASAGQSAENAAPGRPTPAKPPVALLRAGTPLQFAWTEAGSAEAAADVIRNGRLIRAGRTIYLRPPLDAPPVAIRFDQPQFSESWSLGTPPDARHSVLTTELISMPLDGGLDGAGDAPESPLDPASPPLVWRWLQPIAADASQRRGLLEIQLEEESPVGLRIRLDLQLGRQLRLAAATAATLDPASGWHRITEGEVDELLDRAGDGKGALDRAREIIDAQYDLASDGKVRSLLRKRRRELEDRQALAEEWVQRIAELRLLLVRTRTELGLSVRVETRWEDELQSIFATVTPEEPGH